MKTNQQPVPPASFHAERNMLLTQIVCLQQQILLCDMKLVDLVLAKRLNLEPEKTKALYDEIFGCRIEIQSLRVRLSRLKEKHLSRHLAPEEKKNAKI